MSDTIRWAQDGDGVVVLTMDAPGQSANTMNEAFVTALSATVERLEAERETLTGVVLSSAKRTFFAGGDLDEIIRLRPEDAATFTAHAQAIKGLLRRVETLGKPVVSVIAGAAMGGGLELALATHRRIIADVPGAQVGLPEVGLGLLPGAGGIVRTVRMLGVATALPKVLLSGARFTPAQALEIGLVDDVVATVDDLLPAARAWIAANPAPVQPWDVKGFTIPGGTPAGGALAGQLPFMAAGLRSQVNGAPAAAQRAIMAAAVEGSQVDVDTAGLIETRYLVSLAVGQEAKNRIRSTFFDMQAIKSGASRPKDVPASSVSSVVVVGAGMMGAGIAYVAAKAGIDVILKDVTLEGAQRGKAHAEKIEAGLVAKGRTTQDRSDALLARITFTDSYDDCRGVDLVVEAVFEDVELKQKVFAELQGVVGDDVLLASNTSTLPITSLAAAVSRPDDVVGLHFFSPVERMALVEIVKGERTSPRTLARAFDFVQQLRKTPIVVNDSRGFFTSRVIIARLDEAVALLGEGVDPASIEQAGLQSGYPAGPLQLLDELTLTLPRAIREQAKQAVLAGGGTWTPAASEAVFDALIDVHGRTGRVGGGGFYDYDEAGKRVGLWPGLREHFTHVAGDPAQELPFKDLQERVLFAEALEAYRAFDEGVIETEPDANVGSLLGIGFPAWTGGALQYVHQYAGGPAGFAARATELAAQYGDRFLPPASLAVLEAQV
ncbi:MAG: 3-hydroxybutyryl-CoA epimerase [Frankiales bacterium]|nr:3-hydroxybutyryl-CoA epimerase [Frankiales bacterium]